MHIGFTFLCCSVQSGRVPIRLIIQNQGENGKLKVGQRDRLQYLDATATYHVPQYLHRHRFRLPLEPNCECNKPIVLTYLHKDRYMHHKHTFFISININFCDNTSI